MPTGFMAERERQGFWPRLEQLHLVAAVGLLLPESTVRHGQGHLTVPVALVCLFGKLDCFLVCPCLHRFAAVGRLCCCRGADHANNRSSRRRGGALSGCYLGQQQHQPWHVFGAHRDMAPTFSPAGAWPSEPKHLLMDQASR